MEQKEKASGHLDRKHRKSPSVMTALAYLESIIKADKPENPTELGMQAAKLILESDGLVLPDGARHVLSNRKETTSIKEDVLSALANLGYQKTIAEKAMRTAKQGEKVPLSFDVWFRGALAVLTA